MTCARHSLALPGLPGCYQGVSRCVRRAFLCGEDSVTGRSFEQRKTWVDRRLHELAGLFALGLHGYAVMSNHVHVVAYVDADRAARWSDEDVAER